MPEKYYVFIWIHYWNLEKNLSIFRNLLHGTANLQDFPTKKLRKSNVILQLYFGNLGKLLSGNADGT